MNQNVKAAQLVMLSQVFTPSSPIIVKDFFAGRTTQINKAIQTILERGQHAILYGVRGVGKTSLANIISELIDIPSLLGTKVICSDSDTFGSLWIKTLKQIPMSYEESINKIGFLGEVKTQNQTYTLANCLRVEAENIQPSDIIELLKPSSTFFFVFDEFDTIENSRTKKKFAEMIKALSDKMPNVTLLIVGVGETITDLIGEHQSIERCLNQILLEKMKENELEEILNKGLTKLEMSIDDTVKNKIISFSKGFAHYTHLLGKYSAQSALSQGRTNITELDFTLAIDEAIQNAQESLRECYQRAVTSNKKQNMFKDIVKACTLVKEDEHGTFRIKDLQEPLLKIVGQKTPSKSYQYHVGRLCTPEKGNILQKIGTKNNFRYKFKNPLFKAYMTLKIYQEEH